MEMRQKDQSDDEFEVDTPPTAKVQEHMNLNPMEYIRSLRL